MQQNQVQMKAQPSRIVQISEKKIPFKFLSYRNQLVARKTSGKYSQPLGINTFDRYG
jgi:hypothetical protein